MRLPRILFFSLAGCLLCTGSLQAQLVAEREDRLQGSVKSILVEQAVLVRHLDQWAEGKLQKVDATTYDQHGRKTQQLQYETDGSLKKKLCTPTPQKIRLSRESIRLRVSPVTGLCFSRTGKNSASHTACTRQMAAYGEKPSQY